MKYLVISKTLTPDSGPLIIDLLSVLKGLMRRPRDYCTRLYRKISRFLINNG